MIYLQLFWCFFQIGAFSFGGGYAALSLIQSQVVDHYRWMSVSEFTNLVTISQMTPGPIGINAATFIGMQMEGILGALAATVGYVLPSCVLITFLAYLYYKYHNLEILTKILSYLRPAIVGIIAATGLSILLSAVWVAGRSGVFQGICWEQIVIFVIAFLLLRKTKIDPIVIMILCGVGQMAYQIIV